MLANLNRNQDEFGSMLKLAADYTQTLNASGDLITAMGRNLSTLVSEYAMFGARLNAVLARLGSLLERVRGLALLYDADIDPLVRQIDSIGRQFGPALARYTPLITQGRDLIKRLEGMVKPDGTITVDSSPIILSSDICVPIPGAGC